MPSNSSVRHFSKSKCQTLLIRLVLEEDRARHDLTSRALLQPGQRLRAAIRAKQPGIIAGASICRDTFRAVDTRIRVTVQRRDGQPVRAGDTILTLHGPARAMMAAERTALNFLGHLSGVATLTSRFVRQVKPHRVAILETRKTIPGLRDLEKAAVRAGGGHNHRLHLADAILIKTNHLRAVTRDQWRVMSDQSITTAVARARRIRPKKFVEIEVTNFRELKAALSAKPDAILLDNWRAPEIRRAVVLRNSSSLITHHSSLLEVSGGVTLANVRRIAATGVERISIGQLTHSAPALDVSLRIL